MKIRYFIFAFIPLVFILAVSELALRAMNFRYSDTPLAVQTIPTSMAENASQKTTMQLFKEMPIKKDHNQFWVPVKDPIEGKYTVEKKNGVIRIATLGCSCTYGCFETQESYPSLLEKLLNQSGNDKRYEVLNAGVGSYSSFQGLQRLKHVVLKYKPDIVTVFFGWNDHWVARTEDKDIRIRGDWEIRFLNFFEQFRVFQALNKLISFFLEKKQHAPSLLATGARLRVAPKDYAANLKEIIRIARENGAQPVLVTAPFNKDQFVTPNWVWPFQKEYLVQTHEFYNQIVRKTAGETGVPLIDLDVAIQSLKNDNKGQMPPVFSDGIHYNPTGCQLIANMFFMALRQLNVLK